MVEVARVGVVRVAEEMEVVATAAAVKGAEEGMGKGGVWGAKKAAAMAEEGMVVVGWVEAG